ncbi:MAG: ABC transporter ATP-binding protein [Flavobacteriaceae bacterium]
MTTLEAGGITIWRDSRALLERVTARFEKGLVGLVGPNGAGKTTLLRALAGLIAPDEGAVRLDGTSLYLVDPENRARAIAYLAQETGIHWPLPVRDVVALGRLPHRDAGQAGGLAACRRAMELTATATLAGRSADTLSGGERARVLIARALAVDAPILLADEPTAALDLRHRLEVFTLFRQLADEGRLVIAAFHDLALADRFADRVLVLDEGRIAADAPPRKALSEELVARVFGVRAGRKGRFGPEWKTAEPAPQSSSGSRAR